MSDLQFEMDDINDNVKVTQKQVKRVERKPYSLGFWNHRKVVNK